MAIFRYEALDKLGKPQKGIIEAESPAGARSELRRKGLFVKRIVQDTEKKDRELFPALSRLFYRVPRRDVSLFARQLGTLLEAGLPLDKSMSSIIDQTENEYLKKALFEIRSDVVEGEKLSAALSKHSGIFPAIYSNLVSVGEKTGAYEQTLIRLADLEDANLALRNKVTTAMFYPMVMLCLLGGIMVFLLTMVFPQIQALFVQMDAQLPLITRIVIGLSEILGSWRVVFVFLFVGGIIYVFRRWKGRPEGRMQYERFLLTKPVIGSLLRKVILARFARNLGVMLDSRVPLILSLQVVARLVDHLVFEKEIHAAIDRIKEGAKISSAFKDSELMTQMILGMISAGEMSDSLPSMMLKIADILDDDVNAGIARFSTLMEPAMMVLMGGVIVVMMLAIMLPMIGLTKQLQL